MFLGLCRDPKSCAFEEITSTILLIVNFNNSIGKSRERNAEVITECRNETDLISKWLGITVIMAVKLLPLPCIDA